MSRRRNSISCRSLLLLAAVAPVLLAGCNRSAVYSHFEAVDAAGWSRYDTLHFAVVAPADGSYSLRLDLRTNSLYPYTQLVLSSSLKAPHGGGWQTVSSVVDIVDNGGTPLGRGISIYQHAVLLPRQQLKEGDTLRINVAHAMARQQLPGIADVGITASLEEE